MDSRSFTYIPSILVFILVLWAAPSSGGSLAWPVACIPGQTCNGDTFYLGYPDTEGSGRAFDCGKPGYTGHTGTDITVSSVKDSIAVLAAADGEVILVAGGKSDHCTEGESSGADCLQETAQTADPGAVCLGADGCFSWGFDAGNFILLRHGSPSHQLYTLYAHLRRGSIATTVGRQVKQGEKIAEVGNSGASLAPHLHFGVFAKRPYGNDPIDPWQGHCSPVAHQSLWQYEPPYRSEISVAKAGSGEGVVTCDGGRIPCPSNLPITVIPGTSLTFKAVPYFGSQFSGWQGSCSGTGSTCTVMAEGTVAVKAIFTRETPVP